MKRNRKVKCIICDKIFSFNIEELLHLYNAIFDDTELYNDKSDDFYNMIKCCSEKCFNKMSNKQHKEFFKQQTDMGD